MYSKVRKFHLLLSITFESLIHTTILCGDIYKKEIDDIG